MHLITVQSNPNGGRRAKFAFETKEELTAFRAAAKERGWATLRFAEWSPTTAEDAIGRLAEIEQEISDASSAQT